MQLTGTFGKFAAAITAVTRTLFSLAIVLAVLWTAQAFAAGDLTLLHTFTGGKDGSYPDGALTSDGAGNLYGTTQIGGAFGAGTIFELSPAPDGGWHFSLLYTFTGGADGGNPLADLVFDAAGNVYATVSSGGANGLGAVVELSPSAGAGADTAWRESVLYSFQGGADGALPFGNVVFDAAGNLYGTTSIGGHTHIGCPPAKGCGIIYQLSPNGDGTWSERILHRLSDAFGEGAEPRAGLVMDSSGNLYGTTYEGGNNEQCGGYGCGSVFELSPPSSGKHWTFKTLIDFNGVNGALVRGGLTWNDGSLFGTTLYGGTNNDGIVFALMQESGRWKFSTVYSFDGINGLEPSGNLAFDGAGNLYGAAYEGGTNDWGAVFQLVPSDGGWTENVLYNFAVSGKGYGANPLGGVTLDPSGDIYLTNNQGGNLKYCQPNSGCGTVIKISSPAP